MDHGERSYTEYSVTKTKRSQFILLANVFKSAKRRELNSMWWRLTCDNFPTINDMCEKIQDGLGSSIKDVRTKSPPLPCPCGHTINFEKSGVFSPKVRTPEPLTLLSEKRPHWTNPLTPWLRTFFMDSLFGFGRNFIVKTRKIFNTMQKIRLEIPYNREGPSIKDVRSQGGGDCSLRTRRMGEGGREGSDADVRTSCRKNLGFFEIYGVSARTKGERSIFRDFVRTTEKT